MLWSRSICNNWYHSMKTTQGLCVLKERDNADLHPFLTLLANFLRRIEKLFKSGNPGRSEQIAIKPGNEANEIDCRSNAKMLHMRFRPTQIPRTMQIKGTYSLRDGCFNPCTQSILLLEGVSTLDLPGDLEGRVLCLPVVATSYIRAQHE